MKKYISLAVMALMASSGFAMAQGFGGGRGGGALQIEEDDLRGGRAGRGGGRGGAVEIEDNDIRGGRGGGRDGIAVGEPRPDRGGRDWDRGRDYGRSRETVILRTLPPRYRFVEERGRRCRIVITQRQRPNGTIVSTERREC